jgi:hypothetical protein
LIHQYPDVYGSCVVHDPWLYACSADIRLGKAKYDADVLSITSQLWQWKRNLKRISNVHSFPRLHTHRSIWLELKNGKHHNFHDLAVITPLVGRWLNMLGTANPPRALKAVNATTLSFLRIGLGNELDEQIVNGRVFEDITLAKDMDDRLEEYEEFDQGEHIDD